jgi:hypothetical protein
MGKHSRRPRQHRTRRGLGLIHAWIPQGRADWYMFLNLLVSLLAVLLTLLQPHSQAPPSIEIINQVTTNCGQNSPLPPLPHP